MSPVNAPSVTRPGGGTTEWRTPPGLFRALDRRYQFTYDPAASHQNALCRRYSTPGGTFERVSGTREPRRVSRMCGLLLPWAGRRVFVNPPYARGQLGQWVEKAYRERNKAQIIVALLPAATETLWFQRYILPHCHIDWLPRRVRFTHADEPCREDCRHELGAPAPSPTTGHVVALFRGDLVTLG